MKADRITVCALAAIALLPACSDKPGGSGRPSAFVCVPPHANFAKRIVGGLVDIHTLVGPDDNPHTYEPAARQMTRLARADLYFRVGMPFEDVLIGKLGSGPDAPKVIDTRAGISLLAEQGCGHDHGRQDEDAGTDDHDEHEGHDELDEHDEHEGHCAHCGQEGKDPHVWMSPKLAAKQVATMTDAFCQAYPEYADAFRKNARQLTEELTDLHLDIAQSLAPLAGRTFFVFHPAYGYFATEYGMVQQAVEVEGKSPSLKDINALIAKAKAQKVRVLFVEPQFSSSAARTIAAEIGGVVEPIDPLAEDYFANMRRIALDIRKALSEGQ